MTKIKPIDCKYCIPFYGNKHSQPYGWVLFEDEDGKTRKMYYELGQQHGKYEVINDGGTLHHPELMVTRTYKGEVVLREYISGDFAYKSGLDGKNKTKYLGGPDIVRMSKYFSAKGYGGWVYEWLIDSRFISKVKESLRKHGYQLVLEKWDKEKQKYYKEEA